MDWPTTFSPERGFVVLDGLLDDALRERVLAECEALLEMPPAQRHARDRIAQGTRHLAQLADRSSAVAEVLELPRLIEAVTSIIGPQFMQTDVSFRAPQPGFGEQKLHADDVPKLDNGPDRVATAIVALTDFTERNGSTRLVPGSHRRLDLQRQAGSLDSHADEIALTGTAGSAFVFSGHLLHSGTKNESDADRPALQLVWRSA